MKAPTVPDPRAPSQLTGDRGVRKPHVHGPCAFSRGLLYNTGTPTIGSKVFSRFLDLVREGFLSPNIAASAMSRSVVAAMREKLKTFWGYP